MKTTSHLILSALIARRLPERKVNRPSFLIGSVAPDFPLIALFGSTTLYFWFAGSSFHTSVCEFSRLYFHNMFYICAHNLLHSPISLTAGLLGAFLVGKKRGKNLLKIKSFLYGCALHVGIDIPTHFDDGPLLLWPFDWDARFRSPVSHWDMQHNGLTFLVFEIILNIAGIYLLIAKSVRRTDPVKAPDLSRL